VVRADAKLGVHLYGVYYYAGVQEVFGVEELLHLFEGFEDLRPVHPVQKLRAGEAVAVLAGDGTFALYDEVRYLLAYLPHTSYAFGVGGIQRRTDVESSYAGVAVEAGPGAVLLQDLLESGDELFEVLCGYGCVFYKCYRLGFLCGAEEERQDGLAEFYRLLHLGSGAQGYGCGGPDLAPYVFQVGEAFFQFFFGPAPLDNEEGAGLALYEARRAPVRRRGPRAAYRYIV
jgi:hypothetical protein